MKKQTYFIIAFCLFAGSLLADTGSSVTYRAEFYLKNGTVVKGSLEASGYEDFCALDTDGTNAYCNDSGMVKVVRWLQQRGCNYHYGDGGIQNKDDLWKVPVYKNIYYLEPLPATKQAFPYPHIYGFTTEDDIVFIDSNDVQKIIFLGVEHRGRDMWGELVVGTQDMIDTVKIGRFHRFFPDVPAEDEEFMWGHCLISYNPDISREELSRLYRLKLDPLSERNFWRDIRRQHGLRDDVETPPEMQAKVYQDIRMWFWERGILLINSYGNC